MAEWLTEHKGKVTVEEFQKQLNEILSKEGVIRKNMIIVEIEGSADFSEPVKELFAKYRVSAFGEVVRIIFSKLNTVILAIIFILLYDALQTPLEELNTGLIPVA